MTDEESIRTKLMIHCLHTIDDFVRRGPQLEQFDVLDTMSMWRAFVKFQQDELERIAGGETDRKSLA